MDNSINGYCTFKICVKQEKPLKNILLRLTFKWYCLCKSEKLRPQLFNFFFFRTDGIVIKPVIPVRGKYHFKILFMSCYVYIQYNEDVFWFYFLISTSFQTAWININIEIIKRIATMFFHMCNVMVLSSI